MATDREILDNMMEQVIRLINAYEKKKTRYIFTIVTSIKNNKYYGEIDGQTYELPNATNMEFQVGSRVIVCIPNGDFVNKFIIGKGNK